MINNMTSIIRSTQGGCWGSDRLRLRLYGSVFDPAVMPLIDRVESLQGVIRKVKRIEAMGQTGRSNYVDVTKFPKAGTSKLSTDEMPEDYCADLGMYNHQIGPLERSKPKLVMEDLLEATKPMEPFPWGEETDMKVDDFDGVLANLIRKLFSDYKNLV